ncbi:hypothetical protein Tco_0083865 [Tanacetum coccineum]
MEECYKALSDQLDWTKPEGDRFPFELSKPIPLEGRPGHLIVHAKYFFNNDVEYLKSENLERKYTTSITKTKDTRGDYGEKSRWHKLFHLNGDVIVHFAVALHMFTKRIVIQKRVKDVQLGVESYQKKLNITKTQKDFPTISAKEPYTSSFDPQGVIYEDLNKPKRLMQADELYKFSDGMLKSVRDTLHHRLLNFRLGYNKGVPKRKWSAMDQRRSGIMVDLIDKQLLERMIM